MTTIVKEHEIEGPSAATDLAQLRDRLKAAGVNSTAMLAALKAAHGCDDKCGTCMPMADDYGRPFGGARTWGDLDNYLSASQRSSYLSSATYQFDSLVSNIMDAEEDEMPLADKAAAIASLALQLEERIRAADAGNDPYEPENKGLWARVKSLLTGTNAATATPDPPAGVVTTAPSPFGAAIAPGLITVFKDASGRYRYIAVASNRYEDKDGEIFSAASHREYVDWANRTKSYPELWLWHTKGTRLGQADAMAYDDDAGFRISTGLFDAGKDAQAVALMAEPQIAMSHGYVYDDAHYSIDTSGKMRGVYERYRTFEESVLPGAKYAANEGTAFAAAREDNMALKGEQREFFTRILGEETTQRVEAGLGEWGKEYEAAGVAFKALFTEPPAAKADPAPVAEATNGAVATADPPAADPAPADPPVIATATAPAEEGDEPNGEAAPADGDAGEKVVAALKTLLEPVQAAITDLGARLEKVETKETAPAAMSLEDQIAEIIAPRRLDPTAVAGKTGDDDNAPSPRSKLGKEMQSIVDKANSDDGLDLDEAARAAVPYVQMLAGMGSRSVAGSLMTATGGND